MNPDREGLYNAYPAEIGVDETGPNKLATCVINFKLCQELQQSGEWVDCPADDMEITGYFYLEKKDGSVNTVTIDALKAALGWDGRDPFWLQENNLSDHAVQLKLAFEEYNGKTRMKIQYLNPFGSKGGGVITKAEGAAKTAISNRLGPKLRAMSGPAQAKTPSSTQSQTQKSSKPAADGAPPKLPPAKPKAQPSVPVPPAPSPAEKPEANMQTAWEAFCEAYAKSSSNGNPDDCQQQWFTILAKLFPGKQPDELTSIEWGQMGSEAPGEIIPF